MSKQMISGAGVIAAVVAVFMMPAPSVRADSNDDAFLRALKSEGIVPIADDPAGRQSVIGWAHWVCDRLREGTDHYVVVQWLEQYMPGDADVHAKFAQEAAFHYCPADQPPFGWRVGR